MLSLITTGCLALSSGLASSTRPSVVGVARARPRVRQPVLAAADDDTCVEEECSILGTASGTPQVAAPKIPQLTYSEESRQYRRTVYFHESWVKHRSTDRFFKNLASTIDSGVVRSLYSEITIVTSIAVLVVAANMLIAGYDDLSNVHQAAPLPISFIKDLSLPALPFTIAMPALSLLLVFRTNTAYFRWNEARTLWGGIVNTCRNLQRQSNVYFSEDARGQQLRVELANQVALFPKALRSFLRGAEDDPIFRADAVKLCGEATAEALMASKNRPTFMCNMITATVKVIAPDGF